MVWAIILALDDQPGNAITLVDQRKGLSGSKIPWWLKFRGYEDQKDSQFASCSGTNQPHM
jgi:hypothetical protein